MDRLYDLVFDAADWRSPQVEEEGGQPVEQPLVYRQIGGTHRDDDALLVHINLHRGGCAALRAIAQAAERLIHEVDRGGDADCLLFEVENLLHSSQALECDLAELGDASAPETDEIEADPEAQEADCEACQQQSEKKCAHCLPPG